MNMIFRVLVLMAMLCAPAHAQFANQANYAGASSGTNTITIPLANWVRNLTGVPVRFLPANANTGAATANVNGVGAANILKPNNGGLTALTGGELRASQMATIIFDGTQWVLQDQLGLFTDVNTYANSALAFGMPYNMGLTATVGTNALTITMTTAAAGTPSASSPVIIPFRSSTIGSGQLLNVSVTGALSFTIASGATMGCTSGVMCRLWVIAICSSGLSCTGSPGTDTVGLCAFNARSGTNIAPINEAGLPSSASGTSGGSSAQTYYCNISSVTARAIRIVGYIDIQEVTAGTWATSPTTVQVFGPGVKKPGDVVQRTSTLLNTAVSVSSGAGFATGLSAAITPTSAANTIRVRSVFSGRGGGTGNTSFQLSRGLGPTLFGSNTVLTNASSVYNSSSASGVDVPNTTGSTTYILYLVVSASTYSINDTAYGGVAISEITVEEIMSSLEPANDNLIEDRATA